MTYRVQVALSARLVLTPPSCSRVRARSCVLARVCLLAFALLLRLPTISRSSAAATSAILTRLAWWERAALINGKSRFAQEEHNRVEVESMKDRGSMRLNVCCAALAFRCCFCSLAGASKPSLPVRLYWSCRKCDRGCSPGPSKWTHPSSSPSSSAAENEGTKAAPRSPTSLLHSYPADAPWTLKAKPSNSSIACSFTIRHLSPPSLASQPRMPPRPSLSPLLPPLCAFFVHFDPNHHRQHFIFHCITLHRLA